MVYAPIISGGTEIICIIYKVNNENFDNIIYRKWSVDLFKYTIVGTDQVHFDKPIYQNS